MLYQRILIIAALCILAVTVESNAEYELTLAVNKASYVVGEPIVFKTVLTKRAGEIPRTWYLAFGSGFSYALSKDGSPMTDMFENSLTPKPCKGTGPGHDRIDIQGIRLQDVPVYGNVQRTDIIALDCPGMLKMTTILKDRDDNIVARSNEVSFEIKPVDGNDTITSVLDSEDVFYFGALICRLPYDQLGVLTIQERKIHDKTILDLFKDVLAKCPDSAFYEHVLYAQARYLVEQPDDNRAGYEEVFERFQSTFPDSGMLPELLHYHYFLMHNMLPYEEQLQPVPKAIVSIVAPYLPKEGRPDYSAMQFVQKKLKELGTE